MKYKEFLKLMEFDVVTRADYKTSKSGRKTHKEIVFHDGMDNRKDEKEDDKKKNVKEEVEELEEGYDKTSEHHKAARSMAREHGGKATFHADGSAHVSFHDTVTGRSTINPKGTLLSSGSENASRAAKDHGKGKVEGSTVHFKESKDTVVKDASGKVVSFKHEGDWKKVDPKKNPEGKVHNLAGQALKQAKNLNKEEAELNEGAYEKAEENKKSADAAKKQGDMFAHHLHMADHHDNLSQWHGDKGRHNLADIHASKAASHHEKAMSLKEAYGRHDAYTRDYHSSVSGMGKRQSAAYHADGGANDEGWDDHKPSHKPANHPHSVHINGKKWKTFGSQSHAQNVANKIKGATVHKEQYELDEAAQVETKKYSWGTMKTVHHGHDFSIPLHPEHHQAIAKLKDEQEHKFKDETGRHWVARRKGNNVHFDTTGNGSMKTHVPLHTMKEEVELDEKFINGREYASQGVMHPDHAKMDIHRVTGHHVDFYASKTGDKMHGKVIKNDGKEVHIQAHKELGDGKVHKFKVTPHLPVNKEETMTKSYKQFMEEIQETLELEEGQIVKTATGIRHIGTYGSAKGAKYGNTDYDTEKMDKDDEHDEPKTAAVKRGRGRPAGSKSGANQKVTSGKSYGGIATHSLNLPNSNR